MSQFELKGIQKRLETGEIVIPMILIDGDGTIRRSKGGHKFIKDLDDIELIPGVNDVLRTYSEQGYGIHIISNQGGVSMGFRSVEDAMKEAEITKSLLMEEGFLLSQAICPFMEGGKLPEYSYKSLLRKPYYGMLVDLEVHLYKLNVIVDWNNSFMVGGMDSDRQCADAAGIKFHYAIDFFGWGKPENR